MKKIVVIAWLEGVLLAGVFLTLATSLPLAWLHETSLMAALSHPLPQPTFWQGPGMYTITYVFVGDARLPAEAFPTVDWQNFLIDVSIWSALALLVATILFVLPSAIVSQVPRKPSAGPSP